jgi:hypothetical protein
MPSVPSIKDANGLLPDQAIAHTAMTAPVLSGSACPASTACVTELATRQLAPAPTAAKTPIHILGAFTKINMHRASEASAVAASRSDGWWLDRRNDPQTVPAPSVAMNQADHVVGTCSCLASAGPRTRIGSSATAKLTNVWVSEVRDVPRSQVPLQESLLPT